MRFFDLNSPFMRSMTKVADIIILNFLFMLCCIPVITIGPALTALYSVTMKLVRDEEGGVLKEFFQAFRSNFRQGVAIHVLFLVVAAVLFADAWFALFSVSDHGMFAYVLLGVAGFLAMISLLTLLYVYPMLAKFDNPPMRTIQLAFTLAIRHLPTTLLLGAMAAVPVVVLMIPDESVIGFLFLMGILGFSAIAMAQSVFLRKVFDRYIPQEQVNESTNEVHA